MILTESTCLYFVLLIIMRPTKTTETAMPFETIDYRNQLIQYGIEADLIPLTLSTEDCQLLYKKLKAFSPSWIKEAWQLLAVLGDEATYNNLDQKDYCNVNMAHYAALSGHVERLKVVYERKPALFYQLDNGGKSVRYYAAYSDNPEVLSWVKRHYPNLLESLDEYNGTLAHHAARSGSLDSLRWVAKNCPHLLTKENGYRWSIATCAALSGNADQFNLALALSGNRHAVFFYFINEDKFKEVVIPTLKEALKTNTMLIDLYGIYPKLWAELKPMLEDNKRIQKELKPIIRKFTLLIYERNSQGDRCFLKDILFSLFTYAVKEVSVRISDKEIAAQFKKMVDNTENYKAANERIERQIRGVLPFFNCQRRHFQKNDSSASFEPEVYSLPI